MKSDETLRAELANAIAECEYVREEGARLKLRVGESPDSRGSWNAAYQVVQELMRHAIWPPDTKV